MTRRRALVVVVDDDQSIRESLPDLIAQFGFASRSFSSAEGFLASPDLFEAECVVLDVGMPGMSGPDLRRELKIRRPQLPVIFITAQRGEQVRTQLLELGAVACLFKPFSDKALLDALQAAMPSC